jgi:hypothetical protein
MSSPLDGPDPIQRKPIQNISVLKAREDVTERQVDSLLGMIDRISHNLTVLSGVDTDSHLKVDGGVQTSLEVVAMHACTRLEAILSDDSRWNCADFDRAFNQILAVQKANADFYVQQTISAKSITLPSFVYKPTLIKASGKFYAYIGDPNVLGSSIFGEGNTPNEALADFNESFDKAPEEHIDYVIKQSPSATDSSTQPPTE